MVVWSSRWILLASYVGCVYHPALSVRKSSEFNAINPQMENHPRDSYLGENTVDGRNPKQPPNMYETLVNFPFRRGDYHDNLEVTTTILIVVVTFHFICRGYPLVSLTISTGAGFLPSTVSSQKMAQKQKKQRLYIASVFFLFPPQTNISKLQKFRFPGHVFCFGFKWDKKATPPKINIAPEKLPSQ